MADVINTTVEIPHTRACMIEYNQSEIYSCRMTLPVSSVSSIAGILSTGFLGLGALHVLAPFRMCALFGLPTTTPEAFPRAFIYANGGREVMLSIAFFLLGKQGNRDGMKALMYGTVVSILFV